MPSTSNPKAQPPATTSGGSKQLVNLKGKQKRFITILKDDFNFDIVQEIVEHYGVIKRGKKLKPPVKHKLMQNYLTMLLTYCVPKMKVTEDEKGSGKPVQFFINVGGEQTAGVDPNTNQPNVKGGVNITIPTVKGPDGSYSVDKSKT